MLVNCLFVGCGGFLGSVLRYVCSFIKVREGFPFVTFGINVVGSFAIMFFAGVFARAFPIDEHWMLFLRVGLCGGFTTFSTFSAETLALLEQGQPGMAFLYAALSFLLCIGAAFLGEVASGRITAAALG